MEERIKIHKSRRPPSWHTWEGDISSLPEEMAKMNGTLLLDCVTMYLTRLFLSASESEGDDEEAWFEAERKILASVERIFLCGKGLGKRLIAVSNEVGFGLVPPYLMGRRFRDMQGRANQAAALHSDEVVLIVAGLPLWIKK
jgi:adenosylcobinamide kinase/adenosylcobinamide-phosphate guanylyltransferase